ncbi:MAG: hypothetical protein ACM3PT_12185 [Deltaproteobacteria bacterium]
MNSFFCFKTVVCVGSSPDNSGSSPKRKSHKIFRMAFLFEPTAVLTFDQFGIRKFKKTNLLNYKQRRKGAKTFS